MIYEPIEIVAPGTRNKSYGIGVITAQGAFITGPIPPFTRIHVTAFIPKKTIFVDLSKTTHIYNIPDLIVLGKKKLTATLYKPKLHKENIIMNLVKTAVLDGDVIINEIANGKFQVFIKLLQVNQYYQPFNGWTTLF